MNGLNKNIMGNQKVNISDTSLYQCIKTCDIQAAHECVRNGDTVDTKCPDSGQTLLHIVISTATPMNEITFVPFVYMLSNHDIDLDVRTRDGWTALQLAIKGNLCQLMVALLKCGAIGGPSDEHLISKHGGYFVAEYRSNFRKFSPGLWDTVTDGNRFRVNKLVKSWCRVNLNRGNKSLIEYAKEQDATDIVDLLIKHEASIEFAHATIAGDRDRMKLLLCNGSVDLGSQDLSYRDDFFGPYKPLGLEEAALKYGHLHLQELANGDTGASVRTHGRQNVNSAVCVIL